MAAEDAAQIADWSLGIGWDVTYQQVTRGEFSGSFHASTQNGLILHYHYAEPSVIIRGSAPRGMFALAVSEVSLTSPIFQGHRLAASQVITMQPESDAVLRSPRHTGVSSVSVPAQRLNAALLAHGNRTLSDLRTSASPWEFTSERARSIHAGIRRLIGLTAEQSVRIADPCRISRLEGALIEMVASGLLAGTPVALTRVGRRRRVHYVRTACEFVEFHLRDGFTVETLASACGVSVRTLEYAFSAVLSMGLHEYVKGRRLHAVRCDLMRSAAPDSISRVALEYGFSHLGLFAKSYSDLFGELPSATLRGRGK